MPGLSIERLPEAILGLLAAPYSYYSGASASACDARNHVVPPTLGVATSDNCVP
jgi:hypothetical protein